MKIFRVKLSLPDFRAIGSLIAAPRMKIAVAGIAKRRPRLFLGAVAAALLGVGALGCLVVWPASHKGGAALAQMAEKASEGTDKPAAGAAASPANSARAAEASKPANAPGREIAPPDAPSGLSPAAPPEQAAAPPQARQAASPQASEPELLVRRLQDVQERIAGGDAESYAELPRLLRAIAQDFAALPPETWKQKQNARALALYLLSGGASAVGRKILNAHQIAPSEEALAKGAIAYLDGVDCAERDAMLALDPRALDPALGAQVAFVQSILLASYDREKAIAKLDLARLLAPGGLVEEAGLRREIGLLGETANFGKFVALSRQYWTRFRRSPYAENFLRQFMSAVARISALIKIEQWAELDDFINGEAPETRRALYLVMAKTAAVAGNSAFADLSAQRAAELSAPDSAERQRALLYRAAARVADASAAQSQALLRSVERNRLPAADQPLYDATALVSARIFRATDKEPAPPSADTFAVADPAASQAEASLKEADSAIEDAGKSMAGKGR